MRHTAQICCTRGCTDGVLSAKAQPAHGRRDNADFPVLRTACTEGRKWIDRKARGKLSGGCRIGQARSWCARRLHMLCVMMQTGASSGETRRLTLTSSRQAIDSGGGQSILDRPTCCIFSKRQPVDLVPATGPQERSSWKSAEDDARHRSCKQYLSSSSHMSPTASRECPKRRSRKPQGSRAARQCSAPVVEAALAVQAVAAGDGAGGGVGVAEHNPPQPRVHQRHRAHRAWLLGISESRMHSAPILQQAALKRPRLRKMPVQCECQAAMAGTPAPASAITHQHLLAVAALQGKKVSTCTT